MRRPTAWWLAALGLAITLAGAAFGNPIASGRSVPHGYEAASTAILRDGQAVGELVRAGDAESVFALFTPELAQAVPKSTVEQVLFDAHGLPITFRNYVFQGHRLARGTPLQGQFLRP